MYKSEIEKVLEEVYGVDVMFEPVIVLWAAARCTNPRESLEIANQLREKKGESFIYTPLYFDEWEMED